MTEHINLTRMEDGTEDTLLLAIQCDWEDFIRKANAHIWVSCKYRGKKSIQGTIHGQRGKMPDTDGNEFSILSCTANTLEVLYNPSGWSCLFVAPFKTFSTLHRKSILSLDVSEGGMGVSVCSENKLCVWDSERGEIRKALEGHVCDVYKCKFFPSGVVVLSGGADMMLKIWSAETGHCPVSLKGHKAAVMDFSIIDRGRNIISVSKDGCVKLWDCGTASCLDTLVQLSSVINCSDIGIIHDSIVLEDPKKEKSEREVGTKDKILVIGTEDGFVYGISIHNHQVLFTINVSSAVNAVRYLSKENFVAGCQDGRVLLFNFLKTEAPTRVWHETNSPVLSCCMFQQNGFFIGHNDGTVSYYNYTESNSEKKQIQLTGSDCDPIYDMVAIKDCVYTSCRDGKVRIYNLAGKIK